ncbi:hypothetical protein BIU95_03750 [Curtobacterium sp. MCBA15_007]|jgi:hypothetical protein|nr:hypothetical protein H489_0115835 [Curtobacterium flaccumfaciens UCD-AKU]KIP99907.1 hypothetical protein RU06_16810 [Curtobacterium flaccumfaciens]KQR34487.1 hypothetical protein ASF75_01480 [Curtobacterium sp. Leaf154]OII06383.1 hypothetical protein BIU95_03750 [Curtobacterium sp. MCBA15_007]TPG08965.1 hypothetical protein EAH85_01335 [Curtobacterium flaccumfaciens]
MERPRAVSNSPLTTKEPTMSVDLHESTGTRIVTDERTCLQTTVLPKLHDERTPSFGRWLGQINHTG